MTSNIRPYTIANITTITNIYFLPFQPHCRHILLVQYDNYTSFRHYNVLITFFGHIICYINESQMSTTVYHSFMKARMLKNEDQRNGDQRYITNADNKHIPIHHKKQKKVYIVILGAPLTVILYIYILPQILIFTLIYSFRKVIL